MRYPNENQGFAIVITFSMVGSAGHLFRGHFKDC